MHSYCQLIISRVEIQCLRYLESDTKTHRANDGEMRRVGYSYSSKVYQLNALF